MQWIFVADRDCVIDSITVRKGTVQVEKGEKVKKGTVLVSGQVPVLNDAKEADRIPISSGGCRHYRYHNFRV